MLPSILLMRPFLTPILIVASFCLPSLAEDHSQSSNPGLKRPQEESTLAPGRYSKGRYLNGEFQYLDSSGKWKEPLAAYKTEKSGTFLNAEGETVNFEKGDTLFKLPNSGWFKASSETPHLTEADLTLPNPGHVSLTPLEKEIIRLTNEERLKRGLPALEVSQDLQSLSRKKSENMAKSRSLSHGISPLPPGGENIAFNQPTAEAVVRAWMNSDGHRANILGRRYKKIGVGMAEGTGPYWTQMFQ